MAGCTIHRVFADLWWGREDQRAVRKTPRGRLTVLFSWCSADNGSVFRSAGSTSVAWSHQRKVDSCVLLLLMVQGTSGSRKALVLIWEVVEEGDLVVGLGKAGRLILASW